MKEWKRLSKKGKAALIALALGGSLCGVSSAEAAVLAVTIPSDYANSQLGYVTGSRVTDHVDQAPVAGYVQGLNRDPGLYRANINGKSVLLLRQYTYSTTDLKPLQLLDVNGDLRKPIASGIIQNADNPHSAASNGDYVFTANYDTGSITGAKIVGDKLQDSSEMMITSERFKRDLDTAWGAGKAPLTYGVDEEVTLHGEGLYMLGNHLFVAYNANPKDAGWNEYKDGVLAQYDIEKGNKLVFKGAAKIAKNCDSVSINRYNNHFILNGIGGFQHYGDQMNEESGVSIVTTQPGIGLSNPAKNSRNAVIPKNVQDLRNTNFADFYDTKVTSNGTAYILAYGLGAGNINHMYVFKTTLSNLMSEHPEDWELVLERGESDGWFGRIKYDQYTKRFWAEIGSELSVFKDGASDPSHTWKAKDFSTNEQFSLFNSVVAPDGDTVAGDLAVYHKFVPEGISSYENAKIELSEDAETDDQAITGDMESYELESDYKIKRTEGVGDPKTNVYAGIFARDDDDVIITGSKNVLSLELTNDIGSPVGIYAGNGKNVKLDVKGLIVKGTVNVAPEYGNSITNAIWNDPGVDKASTIEVKGPVKIQLSGGHGGNGLAVMKTDRWGENSFKSDKTSSIIVHGDVTIQNNQTDKWGIPGNLDNVYSRFNNAGILTRVNNSKVIVDGNVDFSVYGNGVTTNATGSSVQLGGGSIVVPKGMKYGYYTLAAYNGNIYMNTGAEGKTPGTSTVQLDGDIFALSSGKISVALTDKNSYLHGIADNGGEMNLWLQNGAQWINKAQNKRYVHDDEDKGAGEKSHISRLTGGNTISEAGVIFPKDEKDITIDSYSGHTMVVYGHDNSNPKSMIGGDFIIDKAEKGSGITLRTDNSGLNMESEKVADKNLVNETLNALANKLYYKAYVNGETNLKGKVEIAEGLTAQSASKRLEDMTFKKENGQGQYVFKEDKPEGQTITEFGKAITGGEDKLYIDSGVKQKDGTYKFTKDSTITIDDAVLGETYPVNTDGGNKVIVNAEGKTLTLHSKGKGLRVGIQSVLKNNKKIDITAGKLIVNAETQSGMSRAYGIWLAGNNSTLDIHGDTEITTNGNDWSYGVLAGQEAKINLEGVKIRVNNAAKESGALKGTAKSIISVNVKDRNTPGDKTVDIVGDVITQKIVEDDGFGTITTTGPNTINLALTTGNSIWKGSSVYQDTVEDGYDDGETITTTHGIFNLWLQNGAQWINEKQGKQTFKGYKGSHVSNLTGGNVSGVIIQKDKNPIHVDNYSGKITVIYEHDTGVPTDVNKGLAIKGGDFKIGKAAAGSEIVLRTDNSGLNMTSEKAADKNLVNGTLNALANKLYYTAYKNGEKNLTGKVEIAEGLTAQSASKRIENMTFKDANGQGQYLFTPAEDKPEGQTITEFGKAITGGQDQLYVDSGVKQKDGTYKFTKDSTITIDDTVLRETYPVNTDGGDKVIVNAEGKTLTLNSKGKGLRVGIQSVLKNNKKIDITAGKLIVNAETQSGMSRAYGIWLAGNNSTLDIHGDTEITANGNDWSYGVLAGQEAKINLEGVKIRVNNAAKESGALKGTAKSIISVNVKDRNTPGDKTVDIVGDVITQKIVEDDGFGTITTTGPNTINLALTTGNSIWKGSSVYQDTVEDGYDDGETITTTHGIFNLWLQNGAQWINEKQGKQTFKGYKGSHVSNLTGGNVSGVIIQKDKNPIHVDNYSGKITVIYEHDTGVPTDVNKGLAIKGGDFKIGKAAAGSEIVLRTDNSGLNMTSEKAADKNLVNGTLNALANKLYYTAYKNGEKNLTGKVEIAEGLTAQSASKRIENMTFKKENGQGQYVFTPEEDKPPVSDEGPIKKTTTLTKDRTVTWSEASAENKYVSTLYTEKHTSRQKPMVVDLNGNNLTLNAESADNIAAAIYVGGNEYIDIKNANKDKKISITSTNSATRGASGIYLYGNSHLTITGPVSIDKVETKGDSANGINSQGKDNEVLIEGPLTIKNVKGLRARAKGFNASGILLTGDRSKVTVTGSVDISGVEGSSLRTVGADTEISIGGGTITAAKDADHSKNYYAARVDKGTININMKNGKAGDTKTQITGDLYATGQYGKRVVEYSGGQLVDWADAGVLNVALTDKDSFWTGAGVYDSYTSDYGAGGKTVYDIGKFNLHLKNGATWTNKKQSHGTTTTVKSAEWTGSILATLEGGADAAHAGVIIQKESTPINILDYKGHTTVIYAHDNSNPKNMIGGDTIITKAQAGSEITLRTDHTGLNMSSEKAADKNLVNETLNALANKLYYKAYVNGETNLKGKVEIAEGLTAQSASKRLEDMTFKKENGQGQYLFTPAEDKPDIPDAQTETTFGKAILGSAERDTLYVNTGVLKDGVYHFTKPETTIKIDGTKDEKENKRDMVLFGPWFSSVQAAISGSVPMYDENGNKATYDAKTVVANSAEIDMHGNKLNVDVKYTGGAGQTGISAIAPMNRVEGAGKVNIKNAGAMNVTVKGSGMTAGLFADGGGKLHIYNGGEDLEGKVLTIRAGAKSKNSGVGIKTMNGNIKAESGVDKHSEITIDGLVDVIADGKADAEGYASNEAVSAVASDINIGGGSIKAINGAWAAIRAYGEFTTPNYGIVNVNAANRVYTNEEGTAMGGKVQVHKVSDFEIGDNRAVIEGDIVTNGGMGTKGQVNIGLKDKDSHWIGNYADTAGYGVTQGSFGAVNIKMKDGAYWKGFGNGSMNIQMTGKDTYWLGFSLQNKMQLTLKDGATWYNAITPDQKDQKGKPSAAQIGYLTSDKGVINMLGENTFTASSESLSGRTTADNPSGIVENKDGITGNVVVDNYKGNTTVLYKHDKTDPKKMIGGDFIINKAEKDSMITLRTDNEGMNALSGKAVERNKVSEILNALANKLYYKAYVNGETNLKGKVEIAEGLTAQSASYRLEDMTFKKENGQGQYLFTPATEDRPDTPKPGEEPKPPTPDKPEPPVIYGPKQTAMMRGAKSAMTTTMLSMRDNMTTMTQRLGDIHEGTEDGIWARTYGGKANYDKDLTKTKENFWGVQMGADKKQASGWHTGVSFDYKDGNATYELGGKGDPKLYTLGIYGTKTKDNGEYIDIVAKAGRGQNDYTVYNDMGHKLKGDYKANAIGLSVEYGKKIEKDNMYLTPQIQLSYMKLQGTDYDAISDYAGGKKMHVEQDGMTSLVGRIGIAAGKRTDKTDLYLKANLLHEFKGTTASTFSAENEPTATVDQDFGDTWAELTLGVNHNIDKDKMIYADITKSFGGDYEMEWKANAGIRLRF